MALGSTYSSSASSTEDARVWIDVENDYEVEDAMVHDIVAAVEVVDKSGGIPSDSLEQNNKDDNDRPGVTPSVIIQSASLVESMSETLKGLTYDVNVPDISMYLRRAEPAFAERRSVMTHQYITYHITDKFMSSVAHMYSYSTLYTVTKPLCICTP